MAATIVLVMVLIVAAVLLGSIALVARLRARSKPAGGGSNYQDMGWTPVIFSDGAGSAGSDCSPADAGCAGGGDGGGGGGGGGAD
jgi:hypothetical protein